MADNDKPTSENLVKRRDQQNSNLQKKIQELNKNLANLESEAKRKAQSLVAINQKLKSFDQSYTKTLEAITGLSKMFDSTAESLSTAATKQINALKDIVEQARHTNDPTQIKRKQKELKEIKKLISSSYVGDEQKLLASQVSIVSKFLSREKRKKNLIYNKLTTSKGTPNFIGKLLGVKDGREEGILKSQQENLIESITKSNRKSKFLEGYSRALLSGSNKQIDKFERAKDKSDNFYLRRIEANTRNTFLLLKKTDFGGRGSDPFGRGSDQMYTKDWSWKDVVSGLTTPLISIPKMLLGLGGKLISGIYSAVKSMFSLDFLGKALITIATGYVAAIGLINYDKIKKTLDEYGVIDQIKVFFDPIIKYLDENVWKPVVSAVIITTDWVLESSTNIMYSIVDTILDRVRTWASDVKQNMASYFMNKAWGVSTNFVAGLGGMGTALSEGVDKFVTFQKKVGSSLLRHSRSMVNDLESKSVNAALDRLESGESRVMFRNGQMIRSTDKDKIKAIRDEQNARNKDVSNRNIATERKRKKEEGQINAYYENRYNDLAFKRNKTIELGKEKFALGVLNRKLVILQDIKNGTFRTPEEKQIRIYNQLDNIIKYAQENDIPESALLDIINEKSALEAAGINGRSRITNAVKEAFSKPMSWLGYHATKDYNDYVGPMVEKASRAIGNKKSGRMSEESVSALVDKVLTEYPGLIQHKDLIMKLIKQESGFNPNAMGEDGDTGLMQLLPTGAGEEAKRKFGRNIDLLDPETNIRSGIDYLNESFKRSGGDVYAALRKYNGGPSGDTKDSTISYANAILGKDAVKYKNSSVDWEKQIGTLTTNAQTIFIQHITNSPSSVSNVNAPSNTAFSGSVNNDDLYAAMAMFQPFFGK